MSDNEFKQINPLQIRYNDLLSAETKMNEVIEIFTNHGLDTTYLTEAREQVRTCFKETLDEMLKDYDHTTSDKETQWTQKKK